MFSHPIDCLTSLLTNTVVSRCLNDALDSFITAITLITVTAQMIRCGGIPLTLNYNGVLAIHMMLCFSWSNAWVVSGIGGYFLY
jgi:hypothetical protein